MKVVNPDLKFMLSKPRAIVSDSDHERRINNQGTLTQRQLLGFLKLGGFEDVDYTRFSMGTISKIFTFRNSDGVATHQVIRITISNIDVKRFCYMDIVLGLGVELSKLKARYLGYPDCCAQSFVDSAVYRKDLRQDGGLQRPLNKTGYVPCAACVSRYNEQEMIDNINKRRIAVDLHFPTTYEELVHVNLVMDALAAVVDGRMELPVSGAHYRDATTLQQAA